MANWPAPKIENAPGLMWRQRRKGWVAQWEARSDLRRRGFKPPQERLWYGEQDPTELEKQYVADQCRRLQDKMLIWGRGGLPVISTFDGTIRALIGCYQSDADSRYRKLRYHTRLNYDNVLKRIAKEKGAVEVRGIKIRDCLRWHEEWSKGGRIAMGHGMIVMMRIIMRFGAAFLEDDECARVSGILHHLPFENVKPGVERLTAEQATTIRAEAHARGQHSIALAQAFQFECMLRQKDVIGEWVPNTEAGTSDVLTGSEKWLRGLRWSEIDSNLILKHMTSKRQKELEFDLKLAPMVMEEFALLGNVAPVSGPVIVSEKTGKPYIAHVFRYAWREIADAVGVPKKVKNMHSRAGGISEATDAGAQLEDVRHAATHGDIAMTQRYSRGAAEKTAKVMKLRSLHRNKSGT